ncbi:MAG TPA: hypothetical protein ENJ80_08175 [Gammaproteobacteria bacterium]|nr:hypothetical protein [Gammaproteobacteria bacterium]
MNHINPPVLGLRIGIVGNRDLSGADEALVRQTLEVLLTKICLATETIRVSHCQPSKQAIYAAEPAQYSLVNALAEGADQLAADVVRTLPFPFRLSCPIPFPLDTYKHWFATQSGREQFDRLVADERLDPVVIELDCHADTPTRRRDGYRAAADMLLEHTDILIALYDPDVQGNSGGSLETTQIAVQRQIPVIHLDTKNPQVTTLIRKLTRFEENSIPVTDALIQELLETVLLPVAYRKAQSPAVAQEEDKTLCVRGVQCFFDEPLLKEGGARRNRARALYRLYAPAWKLTAGIMKLATASGRREAGSGTTRKTHESAARAEQAIAGMKAACALQQEPVNALACHYMDIYRGSFILNYLLGAVAVLLAISSYFGDAGKVFTVIELIALLLIVVTYQSSRAGDWQRKAVDYRFMAEFFRHIEWLTLLGRNAQLLKPATHHHAYDPANTWMGWYLQAFIRSQHPFRGLVPDTGPDPKQRVARLDRAYVGHVQHAMCSDWLEQQHHYHRTLHGRYSAWDRISNRIMASLFFLTLGGVLLHLLPWHPDDALVNRYYTWAVAVFVAALPAFLAAVHGITVQGEFERLAERSAATAGYLKNLISRLRSITPESHTHYADAVGDHAIEAAQVMLEEVTDWQVLYRAHAVELT